MSALAWLAVGAASTVALWLLGAWAFPHDERGER